MERLNINIYNLRFLIDTFAINNLRASRLPESRAVKDSLSSKASSQVSLIGEVATINPVGASLIHYQLPSTTRDNKQKNNQRSSIQDSLLRSSQNEGVPTAINLKQKRIPKYGNPQLISGRRKTFNELVQFAFDHSLNSSPKHPKLKNPFPQKEIPLPQLGPQSIQHHRNSFQVSNSQGKIVSPNALLESALQEKSLHVDPDKRASIKSNIIQDEKSTKRCHSEIFSPVNNNDVTAENEFCIQPSFRPNLLEYRQMLNLTPMMDSRESENFSPEQVPTNHLGHPQWGINLTPMPYKTPQKSVQDGYSMVSGGFTSNGMHLGNNDELLLMGPQEQDNKMKIKKMKSANNLNQRLDENSSQGEYKSDAYLIQKQRAKKRWSKLTAVLRTITRLRRYNHPKIILIMRQLNF